MIKCALQFLRKSNQHCPNHSFTIIIHKSKQIKCLFLSAQIEPGPHWWKASALITIKKKLRPQKFRKRLRS